MFLLFWIGDNQDLEQKATKLTKEELAEVGCLYQSWFAADNIIKQAPSASLI